MDGQARFPRQRSAANGPRRGAHGGGTGAARRSDPEDSAGSAGPAGPAAAEAGERAREAPAAGRLPAHEPGCALHHRLHAAVDPADLVAVGAIRRRLRAALDRWGVPELADTAELLASELVTNALVHTGHGAVFDAVLTPDQRLRIEVRDAAARVPGRRTPGEYATSGRGLLLVEALADDWGVQLRGDGKVTWFELGPS
ncbi:ATP-binding protein [Kitasatospora sp. NE20-6]|uniref:ATP-binding protein n=1 Tax=Kitasatospora sp. NE20-6 TaxID=2859066 RepID=UPI0038B3B932